jgi:modification methylase
VIITARACPAPLRPSGAGPKYDNTYSCDPDNLGRVTQTTLLEAMGQILAGCYVLLRSAGLVVLTARPYRHRERLVDLPGELTQVAEAAGLVLYERNAALLVGLRGDRLVPRPSFFQLDRVRKARARGLPLRIIAHEDVLVFRKVESSAGSR